MFGLTIEKLFLVALLAAVIIGPHRLPEYAGHLGATIRRLTLLAGDAARRAEQEAGVAGIRQDWTALDPRQYDPRRIIREAWAADEAADETAAAAVQAQDAAQAVEEEASSAAPESDAGDIADHTREGAWVMTGSSGHPRRVWVPADS